MVAALAPVKADEQPTIQDDRKLVLPSEVSDALDVHRSEDVLLFESEQGVLVTTRKRYLNWVLDRIGEGLPDDVTLDNLIESGREIRGDIIRERYGLDPDPQS
jgi:hypothetical protein